MKALHAFCVVLLIFGSFSEAKFDDFEDEEDIVEYDDNDFAEFEDVPEDSVTESPQRVITTEDDEDETTVELEGQDETRKGILRMQIPRREIPRVNHTMMKNLKVMKTNQILLLAKVKTQ